MMGTKTRSFTPLPHDVSLEDLVPEDSFYRRHDHRTADICHSLCGISIPLCLGHRKRRAIPHESKHMPQETGWLEACRCLMRGAQT
jgi:hypothetical protein